MKFFESIIRKARKILFLDCIKSISINFLSEKFWRLKKTESALVSFINYHEMGKFYFHCLKKVKIIMKM